MMDQALVLGQALGGQNPVTTVGFIVVIFAIMYFLMIRPQQKQLRDHRALLAGLKKGDEVITQGGILGRIYAMADKVVTLEIANGVRVRVLLTSIQGRASTETEAPAARGDEKKEEK